MGVQEQRQESDLRSQVSYGTAAFTAWRPMYYGAKLGKMMTNVKQTAAAPEKTSPDIAALVSPNGAPSAITKGKYIQGLLVQSYFL